MASIIIEALELLEAAARLQIRAPSAPTPKDINDACFRDNQTLRHARRQSTVGHVAKIMNTKQQMEELESILQRSAFPSDLKEAIQFASKNTEDTSAVESAWSMLTIYAESQNLKVQLHELVKECKIRIKSLEGIPEYLVVELDAKLHVARMTPSCGVTGTELDEYANLRKSMQKQMEVREKLRDAYKKKDIELLHEAVDEASSTNNSNLEDCKNAEELINELDPSIISQMFTGLFGSSEPEPKPEPEKVRLSSWKI